MDIRGHLGMSSWSLRNTDYFWTALLEGSDEVIEVLISKNN